ncbi:hypothetical protein BGZ57DRAFT_848850 [Hyaloscypha finlandica]|nr:hypothetical protein BGZ57DRAFT_848850 [Hyaloscypha finlandica]
MSSVLFVAIVSANFTRAFLQNAIAQYIAAQSNGNSALITALANNASRIESQNPVSIKTGVVSQPMKIDHNISIRDTTNCTTFTDLTVTNPIKSYVIGTRMLFTEN